MNSQELVQERSGESYLTYKISDNNLNIEVKYKKRMQDLAKIVEVKGTEAKTSELL